VHISQDESTKKRPSQGFPSEEPRTDLRQLNKTKKNRRRLLKLNHGMLGGLSMRESRGSPQGREKKI
jgi:hypothetical protein